MSGTCFSDVADGDSFAELRDRLREHGAGEQAHAGTPVFAAPDARDVARGADPGMAAPTERRLEVHENG